MNKNQLSIVEAYYRGYRVIDGIVANELGIMVNTHTNPRGYLVFQLSFKKSSYPVLVHRLVAFQKYGTELFEDGIRARHLDSNTMNNKEANILIGTHSENEMDKPEEVRKRVGRIAYTFRGKYDHQQVVKLWQLGRSRNEIMNATGIMSKKTVSRILKKNNLI